MRHVTEFYKVTVYHIEAQEVFHFRNLAHVQVSIKSTWYARPHDIQIDDKGEYGMVHDTATGELHLKWEPLVIDNILDKPTHF